MSESTLQDSIRNIIAYHCDERKHDFRLGKACVLPLIDDIVAAVAADAVPVVRGEWEINGYCSECRGRAPFWSMASTYYKSNYCPNCGANMRGSEVKASEP